MSQSRFLIRRCSSPAAGYWFALVLFLSAPAWLPAGHSALHGQSAPRKRLHSAISHGRVPAGMAWIPAGEFWMGSDEPEFTDARPWHRVRLSGFWIDKTTVTNAQFARFVAATHYVTVAERKPRAEDFPDAPPENLVAGSVVFTPPAHPVPLDDQMQWWSYVKGADWRHPEGPGSTIKGRENHPVVQIAYEDAEAYARWAGTAPNGSGI